MKRTLKLGLDLLLGLTISVLIFTAMLFSTGCSELRGLPQGLSLQEQEHLAIPSTALKRLLDPHLSSESVMRKDAN